MPDARCLSHRRGQLPRIGRDSSADGFTVERHVAGHAAAPAVAVPSATAGAIQPTPPDVVHLPPVSLKIDGPLLKGSGSCDMKGGVVCRGALRAARPGLTVGSTLLTATTCTKPPWGLGEQPQPSDCEGLRRRVPLPEPLTDHLPTIGRGSATWKVFVRRQGPPIHGRAAGPRAERDARRADLVVGPCGSPSSWPCVHPQAEANLFVGQIHSGDSISTRRSVG